ncbi:unnamed protein product [Larinioides sclopetarius]|uniref:Uncharacterized protein n=1 Tax=Larinioides sclopetarius TaxID=280406 RepID=A0AAV2AWP1_9ARAC
MLKGAGAKRLDALGRMLISLWKGEFQVAAVDSLSSVMPFSVFHSPSAAWERVLIIFYYIL